MRKLVYALIALLVIYAVVTVYIHMGMDLRHDPSIAIVDMAAARVAMSLAILLMLGLTSRDGR